MKKNIAKTVITAALMLTLTACGNSAEDKETTSAAVVGTQAETVAETVTEEVTEVEETTEEVTEEAANVPWAVENEIEFGEGEVEVPYYVGALLNGEKTDEIKVTNKDAVYSKPIITVTPSDEEGYVDYVISYNAELSFSVELYPDTPEFNLDFNWKKFSPMDYYTGYVFPDCTLNENNGKENRGEVDIEWEGKTYHITYENSFEMVSGSTDDVEINGGVERTFVNQSQHQTKITAPADYDGLVMEINKNGSTGEGSDDTDMNEGFMMGEGDHNASDYLYYRVVNPEN